MTKIVFHLGDKKTGSTAIQTTMASGSWQCDSVRLLYPQAHRISHIGLAKSLSGKLSAAEIGPRFQEILTEIRQVAPDVALISAEHFEDVDPLTLKQAVAEHMPEFAETARFIAYVRPHADRIASSFAERVKLGQFVNTMEDFHRVLLERGRFTYTPRFTKWRDTFGAAFELRPMIRSRLYNQDVVADLLHFVLGTEAFTISSSPDKNESLSLEDLTMVRQLQLLLKTGGGGKAAPMQTMVGRTLSRRMNGLDAPAGTKVQMHRALAEQVAVAYREDAAALDAAFFTGTPMSDALAAAPLKAIETEQSMRAEDHYSPREMYLINVWATQVAEMLQADPDYWPKIFREANRQNVTHAAAPAPQRRGKAAGEMSKGSGKGPKGMGKGMGKGKRLNRKLAADAAGEA